MTSHTLIDFNDVGSIIIIIFFVFFFYPTALITTKRGARNRPTDILYTPTLKSLANFRVKVASLSLKVRAVFD